MLVKDKEECEEDDDMVDQAARAAKAKVMRFAEIFSGEMKSESLLHILFWRCNKGDLFYIRNVVFEGDDEGRQRQTALR